MLRGGGLEQGAIALEMSCTSGGTFALPDGFAHVPISATGKQARPRDYLLTARDGHVEIEEREWRAVTSSDAGTTVRLEVPQ